MERVDQILSKNYFLENEINLVSTDIDNQNINWMSLNSDRESARFQRIAHHHSNRNNVESILAKQAKVIFHETKKTDIFFQFSKFITDVPIAVNHFQLRKNFKLLNDKELIYIRTHGIEKYNIIKNNRKMVVLFDDEDNTSDDKIISFDAYEYPNKEIIIVCGKVSSCFKVYHVRNVNEKNPNISIKPIICNTEDKQLVNHVKILEDGTKLLTCCNDGYIRIYDLNTLDIIQLFKAKSSVNHAEIGNNLLGVVGDFEEIILFDRRTSDIVMNLEGHTDFGFSIKFKDDNIIGTGNQDHMCKLWDIRKGECYKSLFGYFEAIGEIEFIDNNQLLFSENMDYMHIYDCEKDTIQSVTYFAYSSGFCYDRRMGKIYQGLFEYSNFGIMVFERIRNNVFGLNNLIY